MTAYGRVCLLTRTDILSTSCFLSAESSAFTDEDCWNWIRFFVAVLLVEMLLREAFKSGLELIGDFVFFLVTPILRLIYVLLADDRVRFSQRLRVLPLTLMLPRESYFSRNSDALSAVSMSSIYSLISSAFMGLLIWLCW